MKLLGFTDINTKNWEYGNYIFSRLGLVKYVFYKDDTYCVILNKLVNKTIYNKLVRLGWTFKPGLTGRELIKWEYTLKLE